MITGSICTSAPGDGVCFHDPGIYQFVTFGSTHISGEYGALMPNGFRLATAGSADSSASEPRLASMTRVGFPAKRLRLFLVGLMALVIAAVGGLPAQAASYTYVSLKAVVTGSTVRATAVVKASSARTVRAYGIVVDKDGPNHHNLVAESGVRILKSGTSITGTRRYPPGSYRYSIFVRTTSRSAWLRVGPEKRFTVGSTAKPTPRPKPTPSPKPTPKPTPTPSPTPSSVCRSPTGGCRRAAVLR